MAATPEGYTRIVIPNQWKPRAHQTKLWRAMMDPGFKHAVAVWHRRAGKDSTALNATCAKAHQRIGTYWHMLPEKEQARKAIWDGMDRDGRRIIDQVFPHDIRAGVSDQEMRIDLKCGSAWQVVGSDSYNSLVGSNPIGVVNSEYSIANPAARDYIRPILLENGGWEAYLYTPRGRNHGYTLYEMAVKNPDWFAELLTINDTLIITPEMLDAERAEGMDDDMLDQEYFCSFEGVKQGSIYGPAMSDARKAGRITTLAVDRRFPVNTFWDIGHGDTTAIVWHQDVGGGKHHFIRSYEDSGRDPAHFVGKLHEAGYLYGAHYLPHDAKNITLASKSHPLGANVWDQLIGLGVPASQLRLVPRTPDKWTAINATRMRLDSCYFDEVNAAGLVSAMTSYRKKWDDVRKTYLSDPVHDWSSNYADAFRQWSQGYTGAGGNSGSFTAPSNVQQSRFTRPTMTKPAQKSVGY